MGRSILSSSRAASILFVATVLCACASKGPPPPVEQPIRSVAIIPVWEVDEMSIGRDSAAWLGGGIVLAVERLNMMQLRREFAASYGDLRKPISAELTAALAASAAQRGYRTVVLDGLPRSAEDPDDFEYTRLATDADVIVHVRVRYLGFYSPKWVAVYRPRFDVSALFVSRRTGTELLDETFSYGSEASKKAFWAVESDARYEFGNFDDVMKNRELAEESLHVGVQALAARIVEQIRDAPNEPRVGVTN